MLREQAVEAMAKAIWDEWEAGPDLQALKEHDPDGYANALADIEIVLDALLDTLEANADEWIEAEAQLSTTPGPNRIPNWRHQWHDQLVNLLAVLRGGGDR